ncbi:MAG: PQQ-dependent sugar dehydrogenase [Anaerolineae bacterium]|nr:PQQ-dependent sugar dehydrogenase [Anaerolineae bacterium]
MRRNLLFLALIVFFLAACDSPEAERVTLAPTQIGSGAPVYTATPTFTPSATATASSTPTATDTATVTPTATDTATATDTPTATFTPSATFTPTPSPSSTPPLMTLTPIGAAQGPRGLVASASVTGNTGWSCGDFPCGNDLDGWMRRLQVPPGFAISPVGQFPGQVMQIALGPHDGRIYATVLEEGSLSGAVYVMDENGTTEPYSATLSLPIGLAFQPDTDVLYVSARNVDSTEGLLVRVQSNGQTDTIIDDLPCCYLDYGNQPNGIVFGPDGWLYMGIGAVTDHAESSDPSQRPFDEIGPLEAGILRINPHTGEVERIAEGLRNPYDIAFDSNDQIYATDQGLVTGPGDRILRIEEGGHHGWPYWRVRGCADCPPTRGQLEVVPDLLSLPDYSLPAGITVYHGAMFPADMHDTLLVALWNGTEWGQRIVWIDPDDPALTSEEYILQPFVTGLIRPSDVIVAPDGSVLVADSVYGLIWRVTYGDGRLPAIADTPEFSFETPTQNAEPTATARSLFVTSTPGGD